MDQITNITHQNPKKRRGLLWGSAVLSLTLVAAACSSGGTAAEAPSTIEPPVSTIEETPQTSDVEVPAESTTPPAGSEPSEQTDDGTTTPTPDDEEVSVDDILAEIGASGFVGTVMVQSSQQEWAAGFGSADRSAGLDNDVDTIFDIGSLTKQFTAAAILRLEMDGRLSVDDTIGQYVDGLTTSQSEITLHQLLTHTAGLTVAVGADDEIISLPDYIARVADTPLVSPPGDRYVYSNVGYSLLTAVIETVTGAPYEVYVRDALFEPAGMAQTGYVLADWTDATIAVGYIDDHVFGRPNEKPWDVDGPSWNLRGNGGILSSMPDMLRWDAALRGNEILDAEAKEKMYTPYVPVDGDGAVFYGYGWNVAPLEDGTTLITHAGTNRIFFADFLRFVDSDLTIVLATNVSDPGAFDVSGHLLSQLFGEDGVCEIESPSTEATAAFDLLTDYPDTAEGRAMAAWIDILLASTPSDTNGASTLRAYVEQSVGQAFVEEFGVESVVGLIQSLQEEFVGFSIDRIYSEDDTTFHVVIVDGQGNQEMISARIGEEPESRVDCLGLPE